MPDYPTMYRKLVAEQANVIFALMEIIDKLVFVHKEVEEIYTNGPETKLIILRHGKDVTPPENTPQDT